MRARASGVLVSVALVLAIPSVAIADEANVTAAEGLFKEGRDLLDKGRTEEACDRFSRSDQLDPAVGTRLNLGECYERLGKTASAWSAYRQAITLADTRSDERRATRARQAAAKLESRLARVTITSAAALPPGSVVTRSGARVDPAALNTPVPVDPGKHTIEASAPNRKPWRTSVDVAESGNVSVAIPELEHIHEASPPPAPAPTNTQRTVAIGLEIGGGVLLATGLVFGGLALSRWGSVEDTCADGKCPSQAELDRQTSDADAARTLSTISTVTAIAGAAALAGGIVLHLTAPRHRLVLSPTADQTGAGGVLTLKL